MAIEVIDKIKQKNNGDFKLMDAEDVNYDGTKSVKEALDEIAISGGSTYYIQNKNDVLTIKNAKKGSLIYIPKNDDNGEMLFIVHEVEENDDGTTTISDYTELKLGGGGSNAIPSLTYVSSMPENQNVYVTAENDVILRFNFTSPTYGTGNYRIYRNGSLVSTVVGEKGNVIVNLGKLTANGSYEYTVTATDYLGIPAPESLTFIVICGGLELESSFDLTIKDTIFEVDTEISVPYIVNCSDTSAKIKLYGAILNNNGEKIKEETISINSSSDSGYWNAGKIETRGKYTLTLQGYTGETIEEEGNRVFKSEQLSYVFNVLAPGEIAIISELDTTSINTETYLTIPFKITTKVANYLLMRGKLFKKNENGEYELYKETDVSGISTTVNISSYWGIGLVPEGTYRYELVGSTIDGGIVSLENAIGEFDVAVAVYNKVQPITSNLIAWFDANEKRNSDSDRNIWYNNVKLGDTYRINLHNLNYNTNGWKHVDETLDDTQQGEYMLKFTGNSYGELVRVLANGQTERYSPFSIFSNSGTNGCAIECVFRTRNVGELGAKVITCQEGTTSNTCGISVGYDTMYFSSDTQTMDLNFSEDDWVHAVFVVDRNIRKLSDIGQDNIENLNQTATMRIYLNGVLCSANMLSVDNFVDSARKSFPLMLNCCLNDGVATNFGECEIKMLRIYNSYLTSSDVLTNYISSFYDITEQQRMNDRNDINKSPIPSIRFKRKNGTSNTFAFMNSITDKPTSKKYCVNCIMEYDDGKGNITTWDNVDVYLQGTSSLQYPMKNYKIKCFEDDKHTVKNKIVIPPKEGIWKPENCYTLKCDFMESSHINNTPTAVFYDQVIDALGGQSPARRDGYRDSIDGEPVIVYYTDDFENDGMTLCGSFMFNLDKESDNLGFECNLYDDTGNIVGNGENSCLSYEGAANSSDTSGCFYKLSDSIYSVYTYYLTECLEEYNTKNETNISIDTLKTMIENGQVDYMTFEEFQEDYDEIDYVMEDWECRYTFNEDDNEVSYRPMVNLINWVSDSVANGTFKEDFEKHFDLKYCIAYYLQMMVFLQVDNAGKNMMMDTWDGVKFYPRPYDMDTQLGLSNTGTETIGTDAELMPEVSPTSVSGTYAGYSNNDTVTQNRYLSYNTKTSKLWNNFAKEFASEIKSAYQQLRSKGVYSVDNIINNAKSITIDKIGEIYYNKDMASKYLSQVNSTSSEFLKALHGNRIQKVIKVIRERLLFCDTLFEYMESDVQTDTLNSVITLRSDAFYGNNASGAEASTLKCSIGISVYTPMYVTVNVGSGLDAIITAYVSPNSTYSDPATGVKMEGTLFTFPIKATDKEMIISGAGNIKSINRLEELNVRDLTIAKAEKILKLNLSNSTRMTTLTLGNNRLLRELDCSMSYLLGTGTGGQTLNLEKCLNLKKLNISYTKLTSMILPTNSSLETIIADGSTIKSLHVDGMEFLTEISIDACENIETYSINNCPRLTRVDVSESSVKAFSVTNCSEVTSIDVSNCRQMASFDLTNSEKINSLNMSGNTGSVMKDLKLYTLYGLKALDVSNTTSLENIRFPKYASKEETDKANNGQEAVLWNNLETFNLQDSSIKYIQYGSEELAEGSKTCNMVQLTKLSSITFEGCTVVERITNLNYSASNLNNLFKDCQKLVSVQGSLTATSEVSNIFHNCFELNDISSLSFNFTGVTKANRAFYQCSKIKTSQLKKLLDACGSSLEEINDIANMWRVIPTLGSVNDDTRTLSKEIFENTPNIKTATYAFWQTDYTTINGDLFENLNNLQNISFMFAESLSLTTVNSNLIKNKPSLKDVQGLFAHCRKLENYINDDCNIFEGSFNITNVSEFFSRDSKLKATTIEGMLDPLTNITNATAMFIDCSNLKCPIPNGLLAKNTKLQNIDCMFTGCTGITLICERLFRKLLTDTNNLPDLRQARGVFNGCSNMTGVVSANFFLGAGNLTEIGDGYNYREHNTEMYYTAKGFFADTAITGYHETFLSPLTKLLNCRGMFYKSSANNTLKNCYYYDGSEEKEYLNTVGEKIFNNNKSLQNCTEFFRNNASLVGHIPSKLFNNCITTIRNVNAMFYGCSGLNGTNLDNTNENISSFTGISDWFNGATNLLSCAYFMEGCSLFNGSIHEDLFKGCTSLQNCSAFFNGCSLINGGIPRGLFDSCRSTLVNTSHMFRDCVGLEGEFPVGSYEVTQGINGYKLCLQSDEGALQVVSNVTDVNTQISYSIVVTISPNLASTVLPDSGYYVKATIGDIITVIEYGLLSECTQLTDTSYMFRNCQNLGRNSSIPHDLFFTSSLTKRYMNLTNISCMFYRCAFDKAHIDEETGMAYLCDANIFSKCPALTDISNCFRALHSIPSCQIYQNMFAKQTALQNASHVFRDTRNLTGAITQTLLINSLGTLTNVQGMFAYTNMTSVVAGFLHGEMKNTKLMYVQGIFYECSNLTGASPEFWNSAIFTKLETSSSGYYGALYKCTKLGNYNTAQNISPNWTANIGWVRY